MTERLHFHFSLLCTGEVNGNPLQYSCLENPRDGRAWWATVYGVAQSWTWLKWLSSSSSSSIFYILFSHYTILFLIDIYTGCNAQILGVWLYWVLTIAYMFQFSCSVVSNSLRPHESQHTRPPYLLPTPGVYSKLMSIKLVMPSSHLILCCPLLLLPPIPPSIRVFSNESTLRMKWPKYWSFSLSISPSNEHPGLISLQSKGLSRVFSNTTVQKHQFFGAQLSSWSNSHICTWPLEKPEPWLDGPLLAK